MLENNGIDEDKLTFLIDLDKKNPEAIKKLVKDAGIDPMDIDVNSEPKYLKGNHTPTDQEVIFNTALEDLASKPGGDETLKIIDKDWDQASKNDLWQHPAILEVIRTQRENGIYSKIVDEIDRQRTLGQVPANVTFLQAYKTVGDALFLNGTNEAEPKKEVVTPPPVVQQPVVTRTAAPKATVDNDDKVSAASPTRTTQRTAEPLVNPLSMSDDEFLRKFKNRL